MPVCSLRAPACSLPGAALQKHEELLARMRKYFDISESTYMQLLQTAASDPEVDAISNRKAIPKRQKATAAALPSSTGGAKKARKPPPPAFGDVLPRAPSTAGGKSQKKSSAPPVRRKVPYESRYLADRLAHPEKREFPLAELHADLVKREREILAELLDLAAGQEPGFLDDGGPYLALELKWAELDRREAEVKAEIAELEAQGY